jgi:hypothetical protein
MANILGKTEATGMKNLSDLQQAIELKKKQMEEERAKFGTLPPPPAPVSSKAMMKVTSMAHMKVTQLNSKLEGFMDALKAFEAKMEMEQAKAEDEQEPPTLALADSNSHSSSSLLEVRTEDIISTNLRVSQKQARREKRRTMIIAELKTGEENLLLTTTKGGSVLGGVMQNSPRNPNSPRSSGSSISTIDSEKSTSKDLETFKDGLTKAEWMRTKVIDELINTEEDYLRDLMLTSKLFYMPIKEKKLLKDKEIEVIFSTMTMLLGVNIELLKVMKQELESGTGNIGYAFCWMVSLLISSLLLPLSFHFYSFIVADSYPSPSPSFFSLTS